MIRDDRSLRKRLPRRVREHRSDERSRHSDRRRTLMAAQTRLVALELAVVEDVKHRALPRIERRDLDASATGHVSHSRVIAEVNRARILWRNLRSLETRLRKNQ